MRTDVASALATRLWPEDVARVQMCVRCARQPATLFGSPETIVEDGVAEAARITERWADTLAASVEHYDHATQISHALERGAAGLDTGPFVTSVFQRTMLGLMLGAIDAQWEGEHEEVIAVPRFAVKIPTGFPAAAPAPIAIVPKPGFVSQPYERAVAWFESKRVIARPQFDALLDAAKRKAFTVANMTRTSMLLDTQQELAKQVREGADLRDFRKFAKDRLISAGWTPASPSHVETIYRTNVVSTYGAGRFAQMSSPTALALRPYWQIVTVNDGPPRQRPTHRAVHGWVLKADDKIWATLWTPFGYSCRCRIRALSEAQVKKLGLTVHNGDEIRDLPDPGFVSGVGRLISPGVLKPVQQLPPANYQPTLPQEPPARRQVVPIKRAPEPPPNYRPTLPVEPPARAQVIPIPRPADAPLPIVQPPPPPPPPVAKPVPPVPSLTRRAETILAEKLAGPSGSNPGGLYRGADGVERYVKFYGDPSQAHGETLASRIYTDLGLRVPECEAFEHEGKTAFASKIIPNMQPLGNTLTEANARKALDGFAADVLTGNWDAAGLDLDNMMIAPNGSLYRIDNGGTFLMRAKAGRKPAHVLNSIAEWSGFFDSSVNPAYRKVAAKAGVSSAEQIANIEAQIEAISALRTKAGGWAAYVKNHANGLPQADKSKIVDMLESRTTLLEQKLTEIRKAKKAASGILPSRGAVTPATAPQATRKLAVVRNLPKPNIDKDLVQAAEERALAAIPSANRKAIQAYSGAAYKEVRNACRDPSSTTATFRRLADEIDAAFDTGAQVRGTFVRGIGNLSDKFLADAMNAKYLRAYAPTSTSYSLGTAEQFMEDATTGKYRCLYRFHEADGLPIKQISLISAEKEVLLRAGTEFEVMSVERWQEDVIVINARRAAIPAGTPKAEVAELKAQTASVLLRQPPAGWRWSWREKSCAEREAAAKRLKELEAQMKAMTPAEVAADEAAWDRMDEEATRAMFDSWTYETFREQAEKFSPDMSDPDNAAAWNLTDGVLSIV